LQDIDSLHLFAQVVSSICRSLDEREILKHSFELLSAFDEVVSLGYRENLGLQQVKTFLEMESHEERIQEIISRVIPTSSYKPLELYSDLHRTKSLRRPKSAREKPSNSTCSARKCPATPVAWDPQAVWAVPTPRFPTYNPQKPTIPESYDSYEKKKAVPATPQGERNAARP
jgi:hypothetical protein